MRLSAALFCLASVVIVATTAACAPKTAGPASPKPADGASVVGPAASPTAAPSPEPLLGHVTRNQLKTYSPWALFWEQQYVPDAAAVSAIKNEAKDVSTILVMGTWCPDSKRELPRYFATMDAAGISDAKLTMIGVDRTKRDTEGVTDKFQITRVPTFIFLRNGKEIGRFVERTPAESTFEAELARILRGGLDVASRLAGRSHVTKP